MPVDNQLYDRLADTWWNDESVLSLLRTKFREMRDKSMLHAGHTVKPA